MPQQRTYVSGECAFCGKFYRRLHFHQDTCKSNLAPTRKVMNGRLKAKERGVEYVVSPETRRRISEGAKRSNAVKWTDEVKRKHSARMLKAVRDHPDSYTKENVCGRVKHILYNGIKLKGSWEVRVATVLDELSIEWSYESKAFEYDYKGSDRLYYPDFYLPKCDAYIEVKGYTTDRDRAKWAQFPHKLLVINFRNIDKIKEAIETHGIIRQT